MNYLATSFMSGFRWMLALLERYYNMLVTNSNSMLVTALILIVITGLFGGLLAKKLRQPLVIGYILAGVVVGIFFKAGFGTAANDSVDSLANVGVALLLFSMGLEFSKDDIKPIFKIAVLGSLIQVFATFITCSLIGWGLALYTGLFGSLTSILLFGVCFVSTSTAVLLKTLANKKKTESLSGRVMIGLSIIQDLTVMPIMLIVSQISDFSAGITSALKPLILSSIFMVLMMTAGAKYIPKMLRGVARFDSKELFLLAVTGIALGAGAISETMDVSFSFGAFLTGIVLSDSDYGKKALAEMMPVRDLFAMLFFVSIGMMLDVRYFISHVSLVLLLVLLTGLSRTVYLAVIAYVANYRNIIPVAMFFGMFPTSEIAFVVVQTARSSNFFSSDAYSLVLCVVVCSMIAGPAIDALTGPVYKLLRKTIWKNMTIKGDISLPMPDLSDHLIIAGGGRIGQVIGKIMQNVKRPYVIIEPNFQSFKREKRDHLSILFGDPQNEVILNSAGITRAALVLVVSDHFQDNLSTIKCINKLTDKVKIITRADSEDELTAMSSCRIDEIIQSKFEAALEITRQSLLTLKVPALEVQNLLDSIRQKHYKVLDSNTDLDSLSEKLKSFSGLIELNWAKLPEDSPFIGRSIMESRLRSITGISIVGLIRNSDRKFISNPSPDHIFEPGDILAVIGTAEQRQRFEDRVHVLTEVSPAAAGKEE